MEIYLEKKAEELKPGEIFVIPGLDTPMKDKPYAQVISIEEQEGWNLKIHLKVAAIITVKVKDGGEILRRKRTEIQFQGETFKIGETREITATRDTPVTYLSPEYQIRINTLFKNLTYEAYCANGEVEIHYKLPTDDTFWVEQLQEAIRENLARKHLHLAAIKQEGTELIGRLHCIAGNTMFQPKEGEKHHAVPAFRIQDHLQGPEILEIKKALEELTRESGVFELEMIDGQARFTTDHPGRSREQTIAVLTDYLHKRYLLLEADPIETDLEETDLPGTNNPKEQNETGNTLSGFIIRDPESLERIKAQYEGKRIEFEL